MSPHVAPATTLLTSYRAETRVIRLAVHEHASALTDVSSPDCACTAFRLCSSSDSIIAVRAGEGGGGGDYETGWLSSHSSEVRARVRPSQAYGEGREMTFCVQQDLPVFVVVVSLCRND